MTDCSTVEVLVSICCVSEVTVISCVCEPTAMAIGRSITWPVSSVEAGAILRLESCCGDLQRVGADGQIGKDKDAAVVGRGVAA